MLALLHPFASWPLLSIVTFLPLVGVLLILLLPKGAFLDCTLETAIDSTLPGMTTCVMATDAFGVDRDDTGSLNTFCTSCATLALLKHARTASMGTMAPVAMKRRVRKYMDASLYSGRRAPALARARS